MMSARTFVASMRFRTALVLILMVPPARSAVAPGGETTFTIVLDRGEDIGQNFGTLFELRSAEVRPLLGAGFLGAYNTFDRASRHVLHVFERSEAPATFEALPRVNGDAGVYLFDRGGQLYARSAADGENARRSVLAPTAQPGDGSLAPRPRLLDNGRKATMHGPGPS
jgi:hypothetical protein